LYPKGWERYDGRGVEVPGKYWAGGMRRDF